MVFTGEATVTGTSLELTAADVDWHVSIKRRDGRNDPLFVAHEGQPVTASEVAAFLPNWRTLSWKKVSDSMFANGKSRAEDVVYTVVIDARQASSLSHADVIAGFAAFMDSPR